MNEQENTQADIQAAEQRKNRREFLNTELSAAELSIEEAHSRFKDCYNLSTLERENLKLLILSVKEHIVKIRSYIENLNYKP